MNCGEEFMKYVLFLFNFLFALASLSVVFLGVYSHYSLGSDLSDVTGVPMPTMTVIILGVILFVIAFLGCWGAIRENTCMLTLFGIILLTALVIEIVVMLWVLPNIDQKKVDDTIKETYSKYYTDAAIRNGIDDIQSGLECCGYKSVNDFPTYDKFSQIPKSCCKNVGANESCDSVKAFKSGCSEKIFEAIESFAYYVPMAIKVVGAIEIIGIIFSLCLASSIRHAERRDYRV